MNIVDYTNQFILPSSNNDLPEDQVAKILEFENIIKCEGDLGTVSYTHLRAHET